MEVSNEIYQSLVGSLGFEAAYSFIDQLFSHEPEDEQTRLTVNMNLPLMHLADIDLSADILLGEEEKVESVTLAAAAQDHSDPLPAFSFIACTLTDFRLTVSEEETQGTLDLEFSIDDLPVPLSGTLRSEGPEDVSVWTLQFRQEGSVEALFAGQESALSLLNELAEVVPIDLRNNLQISFVLAPDRFVGFDFALPLTPIPLTGDLNLSQCTLMARLNVASDAGKFPLQMGLGGKLNVEERFVADALVKILPLGNAFAFALNVEAQEAIRFENLIANNEAFQSVVDLLPEGLQHALLKETSLSALDGNLYLSEGSQSFNLLATGSFIGFSGGSEFGIVRTGDKSTLEFDVTLDQPEDAQSLKAVLTDLFGVPENFLQNDLGNALDAISIHLDYVRFSQLHGTFALAGFIEIGDSRLHGAIHVQMKDDGIQVSLSLQGAEEEDPGVALSDLLAVLGVDLQPLVVEEARPFVARVTASSVRAFTLDLDTAAGTFRLSTTTRLFGEITGYFDLNIDFEASSLSFSVHTDEALSLQKILEICGVERDEQTPNLSLMLRNFSFSSTGVLHLWCSSSLAVPGIGELSLDSLDLSVDLPEETYRLEAETTLEIGENVRANAALQIEAEAGTITTAVLRASLVNLKLREALSAIVGDLPAEIPEVDVKELSFDFNLVAQEYQFKGFVEIAFDLPFIQQSAVANSYYDITCRYDTDNETFDFDKVLLAAELAVGEARMITRFAQAEAGKGVFEGGLDAGSKPLQLRTLLPTLHIPENDLPAFLDPGLEKVAFRFREEEQDFALAAQTAAGFKSLLVVKEIEAEQYAFVAGIDYENLTQLPDGQDGLEEMKTEAGTVPQMQGVRVSVLYAGMNVDKFVAPHLPQLVEDSEDKSPVEGKTLQFNQGLFLIAEASNLVLPAIGPIELSVDTFYLSVAKTDHVKIEARGQTTLAVEWEPEKPQTITATLDAAYNQKEQDFHLKGGLTFAPDLSLGQLFIRLAELKQPEELPLDIKLKKLKLEVRKGGYVHFDGTAAITGFPRLANLGESELVLNHIQVAYTQHDASSQQCTVGLKGSGQLNDQLRCDAFDLTLNYEKQGTNRSTWQLDGSIDVQFFESSIRLHAGYEVADGATKLRLALNCTTEREAVEPTEFALIEGVDEARSGAIFARLQANNYLGKKEDENGKITADFQPWKPDFDLNLEGSDKQYEDQVIDILAKTEPFFSFQPVGEKLLTFDPKHISLTVERGAGEASQWELVAVSNLSFYLPGILEGPAFSMKYGTVSLLREPGLTRLAFSAAEAKLTLWEIPYTEVTEVSQGNGTLGQQTVEKTFKAELDFKKLALEKKNGDWSFIGAMHLNLGDVPHPLNTLVNDTIEFEGGVETESGHTRLFFSAKEGLKTIMIPDLLQMIEQEGIKVFPELGESCVKVSAVEITFDKELSLAVTLGIGLPEKLNEFFGLDKIKLYEEGEGLLIFRTLKRDDDGEIMDESLVRGTLIVATDGVSGQIDQTPFNDLSELIRLPEGVKGIWEEDDWINIDFTRPQDIGTDDDLGCFKLQKPRFQLDFQKGTFYLEGGYKIGGWSTIENGNGKKEVKRGLKIPLLPIREMLKWLDLGEIAEMLPQGIPIQSIKFFDEVGGERRLKVDEVKKLARKLHLNIPEPLWTVMDAIAGVVNSLPNRFIDYLSINIPEDLNLRIEVTPDGGFALDLSTVGDPLQILVPADITQMMGIRVSQVAFGTMFGGAVLRLDLSAEFDQFDLPTLAASVLMPLAERKFGHILPERQRLHSTFIIEELLMLIVYQTVIPIPIPIFCKRLEYSTLNMVGAEAKAVLHFPKPTFSAMNALEKVLKLVDFFSGSDTYLPDDFRPLRVLQEYEEPEDSPTDLNIVFLAGPLYVRLPKLFGRQGVDVWELTDDAVKKLGTTIKEEPILAGLERIKYERRFTEKLFWVFVNERFEAQRLGRYKTTLQTYKQRILECAKGDLEPGYGLGLYGRYQLFNAIQLFTIVANTVKKGSFNYLLQSIDLEDRLHVVEVKLLPDYDLFKKPVLHAAWVLTTPKEFVDEAYPRLLKLYQGRSGAPKEIQQSPSSELLELLAEQDTREPITEETEGIVVFMRGGIDFSSYAQLEAALGLMLSQVGGFRVGLTFRAFIVDLVDVKLLGFIKISPKSEEEVLRLLGECSFKILNRPVLYGRFELTNNSFELAGLLDLFPPEVPITLKGFIRAKMDHEKFDLDAAVAFALGTLKAGGRLIMHHSAQRSQLSLSLRFITASLDLDFHRRRQGNQESLSVTADLKALTFIHYRGNLLLSYDTRFNVNFSGHSLLDITVGSLPILRAEMQVNARFTPSEGFLGIQGGLLPGSFLLTPALKPTGGFAFCLWFAGDHAGDFVLTFGGYHPQFRKPAHYPSVPRLGVSWAIDRHTQIAGQWYLALTPASIMTGGSLSMTYKRGRLSAWFSAYGDFLASWKPFYFYSRIGVRVGVKYWRFKAEVGADLELWGPPLGGTVRVSWTVISFTIHFGAARRRPSDTLTWEGFREFLPADSEICTIEAGDGVETVKKIDNEEVWIVNRDTFMFSTASAIPSRMVALRHESGSTALHEQEYLFGIRPMKREAVESTHYVEIVDPEGQKISWDPDAPPNDSGWTFDLQTRNVPDALWGAHTNNNLNRKQVLKDAYAGLAATGPRPKQGDGTGAVDADKLAITPWDEPRLPVSPDEPPTRAYQPETRQHGVQTVRDLAAHPDTVTRRNILHRLLTEHALTRGKNDPLTHLQTGADALFTHEPMH